MISITHAGKQTHSCAAYVVLRNTNVMQGPHPNPGHDPSAKLCWLRPSCPTGPRSTHPACQNCHPPDQQPLPHPLLRHSLKPKPTTGSRLSSRLLLLAVAARSLTLAKTIARARVGSGESNPPNMPCLAAPRPVSLARSRALASSHLQPQPHRPPAPGQNHHPQLPTACPAQKSRLVSASAVSTNQPALPRPRTGQNARFTRPKRVVARPKRARARCGAGGRSTTWRGARAVRCMDGAVISVALRARGAPPPIISPRTWKNA